MKIGISTLTFDLNGARQIEQDHETEIKNNNGARRVSRVPTLDGSAEVTDTGYSPADRTYIISTKDNVSLWFEYLCKTYNYLKISTSNGCFVGVPARWWTKGTNSKLEILITEELS